MSFTALETSLFAGLTVLCASLSTVGEYRRKDGCPPPALVVVFKPLTTLTILSMCLFRDSGGSEPAEYLDHVTKGLVFCLFGDVLLMLHDKLFLPGLFSFLIGHVFYIQAFFVDCGLLLGWWILPCVAYGLSVFLYLSSQLGPMQIPVVLYMLVILLMATQAIGRWVSGSGSEPASGVAALGAVLFVVSDSALAINKFRMPFVQAPYLVHLTYWSAQFYIALSAVI